jgi:hypothetical protein
VTAALSDVDGALADTAGRQAFGQASHRMPMTHPHRAQRWAPAR